MAIIKGDALIRTGAYPSRDGAGIAKPKPNRELNRAESTTVRRRTSVAKKRGPSARAMERANPNASFKRPSSPSALRRGPKPQAQPSRAARVSPPKAQARMKSGVKPKARVVASPAPPAAKSSGGIDPGKFVGEVLTNLRRNGAVGVKNATDNPVTRKGGVRRYLGSR